MAQVDLDLRCQVDCRRGAARIHLPTQPNAIGEINPFNAENPDGLGEAVKHPSEFHRVAEAHHVATPKPHAVVVHLLQAFGGDFMEGTGPTSRSNSVDQPHRTRAFPGLDEPNRFSVKLDETNLGGIDEGTKASENACRGAVIASIGVADTDHRDRRDHDRSTRRSRK